MIRWIILVFMLQVIHEIVMQSTKWLGFAQKHIWNIIEEDKSSIVFQTCFWANPIQGLVFEILKIIQNYDQK